MSDEKILKGIIRECKFKNEYKPPRSKRVIYYHDILLQNGDLISIGKQTKNPADFLPSLEIEYIITGYDKINGKACKWKHHVERKYDSYTPEEMDDKAKGKKPRAKAKPKAYGGKFIKKEDFIGYSMSYAKDLVVAGKTKPKDLKDFSAIFEHIYSVVGVCIDEMNNPKE